MNTKHTPGPWEAWLGKPSKFGVTGPAAAAAMQAIRAMDDGYGAGLWVEMASKSKICPAIALGDSTEEARANARLIAAAPDLLAVCIDLMQHASLTEHMSAASVERARATIAKATGSKS